MYQSQEINEITAALAKAQTAISKAQATATNSFYNSKYATLDDVFTMCKGPLNENGIAVTQTMGYLDNGELCLLTQISHTSGQWIRSALPLKYDLILANPTEVDKYGKEKKVNSLHKLGSSITYLKRYALAAIVGCGGEEDDDGNIGDVVPKQEHKQEPSEKNNDYVSKEKLLLASVDPLKIETYSKFLSAGRAYFKKTKGDEWINLWDLTLTSYADSAKSFDEDVMKWHEKQMNALAKKENVA